MSFPIRRVIDPSSRNSVGDRTKMTEFKRTLEELGSLEHLVSSIRGDGSTSARDKLDKLVGVKARLLIKFGLPVTVRRASVFALQPYWPFNLATRAKHR